MRAAGSGRFAALLNHRMPTVTAILILAVGTGMAALVLAALALAVLALAGLLGGTAPLRKPAEGDGTFR